MSNTRNQAFVWEEFRRNLSSSLPRIFWILAVLLALNGQAYPTECKYIGRVLTIALLGGAFLLFPFLLVQARKRSVSFGFWFWAAPSAFLVWVVLDLARHGFRSAQPWTWQAWFSGVVLFWAGCIAVRLSGPEAVRKYLLFLVFLGGIQGLIGLLQFHDPQRFIAPFLTPLGYEGLRVVGTLDNPNQYGSLLVCLIPVIAGGIKGILSRSMAVRFISAACGILAMAGLVFSQSRGALVALIIGCICWLLFSGIVRLRAIRVLLVMALVGAMASFGYFAFQFSRNSLPGFIGNRVKSYTQDEYAGNCGVFKGIKPYADRNGDGVCDARDLVIATTEGQMMTQGLAVSSGEENPLAQFADRMKHIGNDQDGNDSARFLGMIALFNIWRNNPIWGVGPGNYSEAIKYYSFIPFNTELQTTHGHNLPMQLLAEYGFPGIMASILCIICLFRWTASGGEIVSLGKWAGMSLMIVMVHHLLDISLFYLPMKYIVPCLLSVCACSVSLQTVDPRQVEEGAIKSM